MQLAALATLLLLVPVFEAKFLRSKPKKYSFLSIETDQAPGPTPQYINYGDGTPQFTTFSNKTTACKACIEYFPEKQDGKRFHTALFEDKDGGVWDRICRAGPCEFRDPQTEPEGGIDGHDVAEGKTCLTQDPVPWYTDCDDIVKVATTSLVDVTRYCSYQEQLFIPPPTKVVSHFANSKGKAWSRIGGNKESLLATINKEGAAMMDSMSFCDSDVAALSGACESVFKALTCVAETSVSNGLWSPVDGSVFAAMYQDNTTDSSAMLDTFAKYCVPLCQNTKAEFCEKFPSSDVCVHHTKCAECTSGGGLWCPKLETCHCPGPKPPCIKPPVLTPLQCLPKQKFRDDRASVAVIDPDPVKTSDSSDDSGEKPLCKYEEFALAWKHS